MPAPEKGFSLEIQAAPKIKAIQSSQTSLSSFFSIGTRGLAL